MCRCRGCRVVLHGVAHVFDGAWEAGLVVRGRPISEMQGLRSSLDLLMLFSVKMVRVQSGVASTPVGPFWME